MASSALCTGVIGCRVGSESQHPLGWTGPWQGTSPTPAQILILSGIETSKDGDETTSLHPCSDAWLSS